MNSLEPMTVIVLIAAVMIMALTFFSKFIHFMLKLAIIAVMVLVILYFLRQEGIL